MEEIDFYPAEQRVLLLPDTLGATKTKSGIILPSIIKEDKPLFGTIIAVGTGNVDNPMLYRPGQRVLLSSYAGVEVSLNIKGYGYTEFKVLNQMDIMGVISEKSKES
jgi:co-chaperonin GroES (HSP10)